MTLHQPAPPRVDTLQHDTVGDRFLLGAAVLFTAAVLIHNGDHARRGVDTIEREVFWLGTAAIALEVAVVVLVCQRHRIAALVAAGAGSSLAAGYVSVHFLPARSWFSDSFVGAGAVSALSWVAASIEVVAAVTLGVAGVTVLRRRGGLASAVHPAPEQRDLIAALLHPVALVMITGNVALLGISVLQLLG